MRQTLKWMLVLIGTVGAGGARATPASGFSGTTIALGRFGDIEALNHGFLPDAFGDDDRRLPWHSYQRTNGASDLYVQNNVWAPGGSTGWHTHPGHSLIVVTAGAITVYESDDPSCAPHVYTAGMGFVDGGGDHVHLIRNEGSVEARTVAVQLIPATAARRIDAAAPAQCAQ